MTFFSVQRVPVWADNVTTSVALCWGWGQRSCWMALMEGGHGLVLGRAASICHPEVWYLFWPLTLTDLQPGVNKTSMGLLVDCHCWQWRCIVSVFALQGSAATSSHPSSALSRSFMATALMWERWSHSSAPLSTSCRDQASSLAFGKGTAHSGQLECPPASVRFLPNLAPPSGMQCVRFVLPILQR